MVVSNVKESKTLEMDSQSLKFGMDRILSEDTSPANSKLEVCCVSLPCAGCISSLYRCCRTSPSLGNDVFYRNGIHAPQPIRPYTNGESDPHQNHGRQQPMTGEGGTTKRKRSWSRAVFSNLQRKGLEKRFQLQKYITKPDRRQLAATLGLTDAQVKVWFQNRRMKWRHTKETSNANQAVKKAGENVLVTADSTQAQTTDSECDSDIDVQTVDDSDNY